MKRRGQHNGDRGQTSLADGTRVPKSSVRIATLCAIDELNAAMGVARASSDDAGIREVLASVQRDLLALGAQLARPATEEGAVVSTKAAWSSGRLARLDDLLDTFEARLPGLRAFVLPGGSPSGAALHSARAVCRRAECTAFALASQDTVDPLALAYLNRLSDLLFALARAENQRQGATDETW